MPPAEEEPRAAEQPRFLIVNADDFGLTSGINRGIIKAHERGIVTSASLMVRYRAVKEAADYSKTHPELSVGLHFDITEWRCRGGTWELFYQIADTKDAAAVQAEFDRQLTLFQLLLERPPTHLDSHQHVHLMEPTNTALRMAAAKLGIPLRSCTPAISYVGSFYGQTGEGAPYPPGISAIQLEKGINTLPAGWTEMGCHPGYREGLDSVYRDEREEELRVLCSPGVRQALRESEVRLRSFHDFAVRDQSALF